MSGGVESEVKKQRAWPMVRLGDVCEVINGLWKGTKAPLRNVGVIRATNFTKQCGFDISKTVFIDVEDKKFQKRKLAYGDIVVERSGGGPNQPVGRVIYFDRHEGDYSLSNFTSALRTNDRRVEPYYLYRVLVAFYVNGVTERIQSNSVQLRNLDFEAYLNLEFPLPPLDVQREIVERLEKELGEADKVAANFKKMIELADAEFKAELDETFKALENGAGEFLTQRSRGAEVQRVRLGDVFHIVSARRVHKADWRSSGVPFYRTREIVKLSDLGYVDNQLFISEELYEQFKKSSGAPQVNDLMVTAVGTVGRVYIVQENDRFYYKDASVLCFENRLKVNPWYAKYYIESPMFKRVIYEKSKGATVDTITMERANEYPFLMPDMNLQRSIVAKLDAAKERCEKLKAAAERGLNAAENLRKAILAEAFE